MKDQMEDLIVIYSMGRCLAYALLRLFAVRECAASVKDKDAYPPRIVQLETRRRHHLIGLPSQISSQSPVSIHHCQSCELDSMPPTEVRTLPVPLIYRVSCSLASILHVSDLRKARP